MGVERVLDVLRLTYGRAIAQKVAGASAVPRGGLGQAIRVIASWRAARPWGSHCPLARRADRARGRQGGQGTDRDTDRFRDTHGDALRAAHALRISAGEAHSGTIYLDDQHSTWYAVTLVQRYAARTASV
jgi:hypothetical protein